MKHVPLVYGLQEQSGFSFLQPYLNTTLSPFHHDYYSIITSLANSIFSLILVVEKI